MVAQLESVQEERAPYGVNYTKLFHCYTDGLLGRVSSDAVAVVLYIVRRTIGYGRESVELVDSELAAALGLPLRSLKRAKAQLRAAGVFAMSRRADGRGKPTVYTVTPPTAWTLGAPEVLRANVARNQDDNGLRATLARNDAEPETKPDERLRANVARNDGTSDYGPKVSVLRANVARNDENQSADEAPAAPETKPASGSQVTRIPTGKERKKEKGDASATRARSTEHTKTKTTTPKDPNPRAVYTQELIAALQVEMKGAKPPGGWAREAKAAHEWYWTAGKDGTSAPVADVMECWRVVKRAPFYRGTYLGLQALERYWSAWVADGPGAVKAGIRSEQEREMARTAARSGLRTAAAPPVRSGPVMRLPSSAWE